MHDVCWWSSRLLRLGWIVSGVMLGVAATSTGGNTEDVLPSDKVVVTIAVDAAGRVTLIDECGRRDGWRGEKQVHEIPACSRWEFEGDTSEDPEGNASGAAVEPYPPNTRLSLETNRRGHLRLELRSGEDGTAELTAQIAGYEAKANRCGTGWVKRGIRNGRTYRWTLRWALVGADSCWAKIQSAGM